MIPADLRLVFGSQSFLRTASTANGWGPFATFVRAHATYGKLLGWLDAHRSEGAAAIASWVADAVATNEDAFAREVITTVALLAAIDSPSVLLDHAWLHALAAPAGRWSDQTARLLADVLFARAARAPERVRVLGALRIQHRGALPDGRPALVATTAADHPYVLVAIGGTHDRDQWLVAPISLAQRLAITMGRMQSLLPLIENAEPLLYATVPRDGDAVAAEVHEIDWGRLPVETLPRGCVRWSDVAKAELHTTRIASVVLGNAPVISVRVQHFDAADLKSPSNWYVVENRPSADPNPGRALAETKPSEPVLTKSFGNTPPQGAVN